MMIDTGIEMNTGMIILMKVKDMKTVDFAMKERNDVKVKNGEKVRNDTKANVQKVILNMEAENITDKN
jgi:hypothetical protein